MKLNITIIVADSDDPKTRTEVTFEEADSLKALNMSDPIGGVVKQHLKVVHGQQIDEE